MPSSPKITQQNFLMDILAQPHSLPPPNPQWQRRYPQVKLKFAAKSITLGYIIRQGHMGL
ncbi:hypothetical protein HYDPIDRAFT_114745 [Hydnomerulius pinastri MD-312]|uniref:Uncharacterized protein n=1 Tax=Hydnomerulius pinastri MD-312 TaxID=994086 RepID=A0A0C9V9A9_9AGAM|nr:hypothetical protein HYDPIDRAFT_114745 [Hydnomerulius pinastri MD-312]